MTTIYDQWKAGHLSTEHALRLLAEERQDLAEEYTDVIAAYRQYADFDTGIKAQAEKIVMYECRSVAIGGSTFTYVEGGGTDAADITVVKDVLSLLVRRGLHEEADLLRNGITLKTRKAHFRWSDQKKEKTS